MVRLSLECARLAVHGDDFAPSLVAGAESIMRADAGAVLVTVPIGKSSLSRRPRVVVSGIPPVDDAYISGAIELSPRHPHLKRHRWFDTPTT
ncbi:MAG TPA: hypothetical protein VIT42_00660, partial [Microlunatus sp.]